MEIKKSDILKWQMKEFSELAPKIDQWRSYDGKDEEGNYSLAFAKSDLEMLVIVTLTPREIANHFNVDIDDIQIEEDVFELT